MTDILETTQDTDTDALLAQAQIPTLELQTLLDALAIIDGELLEMLQDAL